MAMRRHAGAGCGDACVQAQLVAASGCCRVRRGLGQRAGMPGAHVHGRPQAVSICKHGLPPVVRLGQGQGDVRFTAEPQARPFLVRGLRYDHGRRGWCSRALPVQQMPSLLASLDDQMSKLPYGCRLARGLAASQTPPLGACELALRAPCHARHTPAACACPCPERTMATRGNAAATACAQQPTAATAACRGSWLRRRSSSTSIDSYRSSSIRIDRIDRRMDG